MKVMLVSGNRLWRPAQALAASLGRSCGVGRTSASTPSTMKLEEIGSPL
jgi:hypothetical protein